MSKILELENLDIKNISVFNFIEILNSKWIIKDYYDNIPDVKVEYFSKEEEEEMVNTKEFQELNRLIDNKF